MSPVDRDRICQDHKAVSLLLACGPTFLPATGLIPTSTARAWFRPEHFLCSRPYVTARILDGPFFRIFCSRSQRRGSVGVRFSARVTRLLVLYIEILWVSHTV